MSSAHMLLAGGGMKLVGLGISLLLSGTVACADILDVDEGEGAGSGSGATSSGATSSSGSSSGATSSGGACTLDTGAWSPPSGSDGVAPGETSPTWTSEDAPGVDSLYGVWASDGHVFAVGSGGVLHKRPGSGWVAEPLGDDASGYAVWGSSPTDVYVAAYGKPLYHSEGDGTWSPVDAPSTGNAAYSVYGFGPRNIYVGAYGGKILHGDGTCWTIETIDQKADIQGIWGSGPRDVYAASWSGLVAHSTGDGTWTVVREAEGDPSGTMAGQILSGHGDEMVLATMKGTFTKAGNGPWTRVAGATDEPLAAWSVHTSVGGVQFAIDGLSQLSWRTPTGWWTAPEQVGATRVWALNDREVYAVGSDGVIMHALFAP